MIDLEKLENEIDVLLESETKHSLQEWLFNKRYNKINEIIGKGTFVSLKSQDTQFRGKFNHTQFNNLSTNSSESPSNRQAA